MITNTPKPGALGMTNTTRVAHAVTWDTWTTAWQDETRTWDELASLVENTSNPTTSITNITKP